MTVAFLLRGCVNDLALPRGCCMFSSAALTPMHNKAQQRLPLCWRTHTIHHHAPLRTPRRYVDEEGHYFWEPAGCRLRRLTGGEARACLNGRHLDWVGDSLTRYQYMSMAWFLSKGVWPERYGDDPASPSIVMERQWGSWESYYANGSAALQQATNAQAREVCEFDRPKKVENRDLTVWDFAAGGGGVARRAENAVRMTEHYITSAIKQGSLEGLLRALQDRNSSNAVVYNVGMWLLWKMAKEREALPSVFRSVFQIAVDKARALPAMPRLLWKDMTNTQHDFFPNPNAYKDVTTAQFHELTLEAAATQPAWEVYDVRAVTMAALEQKLSFYWDNAHFIPVVYEQFNDLLLNMLCDEHLQWVPAAST